VTRESDERMCAGREFQLLGEDTQKAVNCELGHSYCGRWKSYKALHDAV